MEISKEKYYTVEEYNSIVADSEEKYEYHDGKLYAMAGGTFTHNSICANMVTCLNNALDKKDCIVSSSDQQVMIESANRFVYPDITVTCGEPEFNDDNQIKLTNPKLLIEVLSPSTEAFNKYDKFHLYCKIPSFQEYVLIHSERILVESFFRNDSGLWKISSAFKLEDEIKLYSIDELISLERIYNKIKGLKEGI